MRHQNRSSNLKWTSTLLSLCLLVGAIGGSLGLPNSGHAQSTPPLSAEQTTALAEATRLNEQIKKLYEQGKFTEAIPPAEKALAIRQRILGENHPDVAESLNNLAGLYSRQRRYAQAEPLLQRSLQIREAQLGKDHPDVAESLNNLAFLYFSQRSYVQAELLLQRSLQIRETQLGKDHPDVAQSLNNLARLYNLQRRYSEAEPLLRRSLQIQETQLGKDHPDIIVNLNNLAELYRLQRRYGEAEPLYQRSLQIQEIKSGKEHPDIVNSLNNLANFYLAQGRYAEAEPLYQRSLQIRESQSDKDHVAVATSLNDLAGLYQIQGRYSEVEPLYQRSLQILETQLGKDHLKVATSLNNLAGLYQIQGRYSEVEPLYQSSLQIREKQLGKDHPKVADSLENLARLYYSQGRKSDAESLIQRSLQIRETRFGKNHPDVASGLTLLANLYRSQARYHEAELLLQRSLQIQEVHLGKDHLDIAFTLDSLAEFYARQNRNSDAESLFQRSLQIRETRLGKEHPILANSLNALASLYIIQKRYSEAEPLLQRSLQIIENRFSTLHPSIAANLANLALLYHAQGQMEKAIAVYSRRSEIDEINLGTNLLVGAEAQKQAYIEKYSGGMDENVSLHLQDAPTNSTAAHLAFTTLLRRKGRILEAITDNLQRVQQSLTPHAQKQLDQLGKTRTQLATLYYAGLGNRTVEEHRAQIIQLQQQATQLEAGLSRLGAAFRTKTQPVTLESVQARIPADAALVEIVQYYPVNLKATRSEIVGNPRYAAYLLSPQGTIQAVDLGEAEPIDLQAETFRVALRNRDPRVKTIARQLDAALMQPIRAKLGNTRNLLISPDSQLNLIPFAALVDEQNRYLVEAYTINYLTSGRDLLRLQTPIASRQPPVLLANPDYANPGDPASAQQIRTVGVTASRNPAMIVASTQPTATRSTNQRSTDLTSLRVELLPGTLAEATALTPKLKDAIVLTGSQATENALKQVQAPRILHIATHGFFLADAAPSTVASRSPFLSPVLNESNSFGGIRPPTSGNTENALLRSGLALAGFNRRQSGGEDGVLTAQEAAGLDLRGTQLVVLSACETGIGNVANGEGVYGLRRAFVLAGAASQLTSLWQVSDNGTKDLMVQYYDRLLANQGRSDALRQTQLDFLHSANYAHPYYWAAFVPSGDWRSLRQN